MNITYFEEIYKEEVYKEEIQIQKEKKKRNIFNLEIKIEDYITSQIR